MTKQKYENAQEWINKKHSVKNRSEVKKIKLNLNLSGTLDLSDFTNLKELKCERNQLTSLNLSNCNQLEAIHSSNNLLTEIKLPTNLTKLRALTLSNNNFPEQDLSFLTGATNLIELRLGNNDEEKINKNLYNRFTGSLEPLKDLNKLEKLEISNTDLNKGVKYLPKNLKTILFFTNLRPDCQLTGISLQLIRYTRYGLCEKCQEPNTSSNQCQSCTEEKWRDELQSYTGQKLVKEFIKKQQVNNEQNQLQWIPYEQLKIEKKISESEFSVVYKANWQIKKENKKPYKLKRLVGSSQDNNDINYVVAKVIKESHNITLNFLIKIANANLVIDDSIIPYYGISQNPDNNNYVLVMKYIERGSLWDYFSKNENQKLKMHHKIFILTSIAKGLKKTHNQGLVHCNLHSGNILNKLNDSFYCSRFMRKDHVFIADSALAKLFNETNYETIYGVLPYIAPEVLQGQSYSQASDIYSFGMVAYELIIGRPPFYGFTHDSSLVASICQGSRPSFPTDTKMSTEIIDLIVKCWNEDPRHRPNSEVLLTTLCEQTNDDIINTFAGEFDTFASEFDQQKKENIIKNDYTNYISRKIEIKSIIKETQNQSSNQAQIETLSKK